MNKKILKEQVRAAIRETIADNIDTGRTVGILVEGEMIQLNENFLRRIFQKGMKKFRLRFVEKGQNQIFFTASQNSIEWMSFVSGRLDEKGEFASLDEAEDFVAEKLKAGYKEVVNENGIKEFMKKIRPALPKLLKIAVFGAIGVGAIMLLATALTPGAMSIIATGGMSALVRASSGTVVDFAKDASGWIMGSFSVDAASGIGDTIGIDGIADEAQGAIDAIDTAADADALAQDAVSQGETPDVPPMDAVTNDAGLDAEGFDAMQIQSQLLFSKIQDGTATADEIATYGMLETEYGVTPFNTFQPTATPEAPTEALPEPAMARLQGSADEIMSKVRSGTASPEELQTLQTLITNYGVVAR